MEKFPHIGKVFAKLGQNFTIFSKNQKLYQLPGVGLIAIYRSLPVDPCPKNFSAAVVLLQVQTVKESHLQSGDMSFSKSHPPKMKKKSKIHG